MSITNLCKGAFFGNEKRLLVILSLACFMFLMPGPAQAQTNLFTLPITITSNNAVAGQTLNLANKAIQLTQDIGDSPANPWQSSAAWGTNKIDLDKDFYVDIDFFFGCQSGEWGGDGMTFVLQNDPRGLSTLGGGGGFMGYGGNASEKIKNSIAIEFDDFNDAAYGIIDIVDDHITVLRNGSIGEPGTPADILWGPEPIINKADLESCIPYGNQYYHPRIEWIAPNTLRMYENGVLKFSISIDRTVFGSNMVYWGFTGATANASNEQWVAEHGTTIPWQCSMGGCCVPFTVAATGSDFCAGSSTSLQVTSGTYTKYAWSNGATTASTSVSMPGTYDVEVTQLQGAQECKSKTNVTVNENPLPNPSLPNKSICAGDPAATFDAGVYASYLWSENGTGSAQTTSGTTAGNYAVQVTDVNGCKASATGVLTVNALPTPTLADKSICAGDPAVTFDAGVYASYLWSENGTGNAQTTSGNTPGNYTVQVTDVNGCKASATAVLSINSNIVVDLGPDIAICKGESVSLSANYFVPGTTYSWSGPSTYSNKGNPVSVSNAGTYNVHLINPSGCEGDGSIVVTVNDLPSPVIANADKCVGETAVLNGGTYAAYQWSGPASFSSNNKEITVAVPGVYTLNVTDVNGCKGDASATFALHDAPKVIRLKDSTVCFLSLANGLSLDAGPTAAEYLWSDGQSGQIITVKQKGTYTVELISEFGCKNIDTVNVYEECVSTIFSPNAFSPNDDGINDLFYMKGENIYDFEIFIFDRWGEVIYHSYDMDAGWNGKKYNNLRDVQVDVYVWKISYKNWGDWKNGGNKTQEIGKVTLLR
ncbi:MAG: lectin-like domain-containing protein [Flavobacteriales bacterium]